MKIRIFFLITTSFLAIQLVGCVARPRYIHVINQEKNLQTIEAQLTTTAESINKSLRELAEIDRATHPQAILTSPVDPEMIGMGQLGSIDWSGPVGPLVRKIAEATDYKFKVLGTPPAIPILISVSAKDTPLADILRDIMFQCGSKANIVTYPASKIIELRYVKP